MSTGATTSTRHGTRAGYDHDGCRCSPCKQAKATSQADYRQRNASLAPDDHRHGTVNGYGNYKCRCDACCAANAKYTADLRARRKATGGTTKTPLAGRGAIGTPENAALARLRSRYQNRAGHLHRPMLDEMLFTASLVNYRATPGLSPRQLSELVYEILHRRYNTATPSPDGYVQDIADAMLLARTRTNESITNALMSGLLVVTPSIIPLMRDIADDLSSSPRRYSDVFQNANELALRSDVHDNPELLHAYLDTTPAPGFDDYLMRAIANANTSWDERLITRFLARYAAAFERSPNMAVDPDTGVTVWQEYALLDPAIAALLTQPNAPTDRVHAALPNLITLFTAALDKHWALAGEEFAEQCLYRVIDPSHPLSEHLPLELKSRAIMAAVVD